METPFRWRPKEDAILRANPGATDSELADRLAHAGFSRSHQAVKGRRHTLGLIDADKPWANPAQVAKLEKLYGDGWTSSQIAKALNGEFGTSYSRNAVIGKVHRSGLLKPERRAAVQKVAHLGQRPPKATKAARQFQHGGGCVVDLIPKDVKPIRVTGPLPGSLNLPMWHEDFGGCRYPTSGEDVTEHLFCCLPVEDGSSYCRSHSRACGQPVPATGRKSATELARSLRRFA